MKAVILAGGFGTRLSEETISKPKPMVEIGDKPILWHILNIYSYWGINEFIICLGYKGYIIKEYFVNYHLHNCDITVDIKSGEIYYHNNFNQDWKITLVDTGLNTMTGGRIKRIQKYINNETFMLTYGDAVADININQLYKSHIKSNKIATVTAVRPPGRFGTLIIDNENNVIEFIEKPAGDGTWINGGFFVLEPEIFNYIKDDSTIFEREPLERLAKENQLNAYKHYGFWKAMDTLRDKIELENLWNSGTAPWKLWD
ncbi:glucose-1-phosphate cytidylyltransferase [Caldicellulosiruptor kronotskyensis 2002]|uniref:Glucose-1-phosphate cytidylyltransferase n=1 Tax=Caldicellulosiruptor kronotskyensis (strain DSM 18902 / VKM B-2412 / 2002) TaxID=632348 RepID=E4SCJ6_CALK2|nr:glucose-1-phosphate cytidylyltransferase [Caldicellulosiruptor kronotskyensis]ADQ45930.1 glucose-1-phosphate cytidylyltransferase [Caldicellulosiruptor kronotskyensis 2002]